VRAISDVKVVGQAAALWPGLARSAAIVPAPRNAPAFSMARGIGLAALFRVASLTARLRAAPHGVTYRYLSCTRAAPTWPFVTSQEAGGRH